MKRDRPERRDDATDAAGSACVFAEKSTPLSASNSSSDWPEPIATQCSGFWAMTIGMPVSCSSRWLEAVQQRATAGEHDALLHDVGGQLGRRLVERDLHRVGDRGDRLLDGLADLVGGGDDRLGEAR